MTWLPIFDTANAWPDPAAMWARGFRVFAAYAGSQSWKAVNSARLNQWRTVSHPFATAPMFESSGDEPINSPGSGTAHARAARAAWRGLGCPDSAAIAYAVDRDVTLAQIKGNVAKYFELVGKADTTLPIAYLENDGAEWLHERGLIAGGFIPAAYSWGDPAVLMTPGNAPSWVLWTQEHNATVEDGAQVDIGHIRTTAPIWWPKTLLGDVGGPTMAGFDNTDAATLLGYVDPFFGQSLHGLLKTTNDRAGAASNTQLPAIAATLAGLVKTEAAIAATLAAMTAGGTSVDTAALAAQIKAVGDQESAAVTTLSARVATLEQTITDLETRLAAAASAEATALKVS